MKPSEVVEAIRKGDWEIVDSMGNTPGAWISSLKPALKGLAPEQRELAIECLLRTGGADATDLLLEFAGDPDAQIATFAAQALAQTDPLPKPSRLLELVDRTSEPVTRRFLYRALGRSKDPTVLQELRRRMKRESDRHLIASAARLGDGEARDRLCAALRKPDPDLAEELAEHVEFVGDRNLARGLLPWLSDLRMVFTIDPHCTAVEIRVCDLALFILEKFDLAPSAARDAEAPYSEELLREARRLLEGKR